MNDDWYKNERWVRAPKHVLSAAVTVLDQDEQLLLVRSPARGWEIPGGQVELAESLTQAAAREVEEESGILIEVTGYCGIFQTIPLSICNLIFTGRPVGGALRTSSESLEVGWYPLAQALDMVTYANFRERIEMSLDSSQWPFLVEYTQ